jgi:hypothetical protein
MRIAQRVWVAIGFVGAIIGGCGGASTTNNSTPSSPFNGIYRTSLTRGNTAVTLYLNYPEVEAVVTDEGGALPSFVGSSTTVSTNTGGVVTFTSLPLTGSDGEVATASGTFGTATSGSGNVVTLTITGGVGFSGQVAQSTSSTNSIFVGTYGGTYTTTYTTAGVTRVESPGTVTSLTLAADSNTGGYDLNASGSTTDPTGNPVNFTITNAQVDPCGIVSNLSVVYSYSAGSPPTVTNTYGTAYLNLGVVATTTLVGFQQSTATNWSNNPVETDALLLTQSSTNSLKRKK